MARLRRIFWLMLIVSVVLLFLVGFLWPSPKGVGSLGLVLDIIGVLDGVTS